ncbi:hypothetical protein U9M48_000753, partial [Paspalum notatum var. saurae]
MLADIDAVEIRVVELRLAAPLRCKLLNEMLERRYCQSIEAAGSTNWTKLLTDWTSATMCSVVFCVLTSPVFLLLLPSHASHKDLLLQPDHSYLASQRHYCPTEENFQEFKSFLKENMIDLTDVKATSELGTTGVEGKVTKYAHVSSFACERRMKSYEGSFQRAKKLRTKHLHLKKPTLLPEAVDIGTTETEKCEEETAVAWPDSSEDDQEAPVPREKILERINSKGMKSEAFQSALQPGALAV